jgi:hypothetical protein
MTQGGIGGGMPGKNGENQHCCTIEVLESADKVSRIRLRRSRFAV